MFKRRQKELEEAAKKEENYRPTSELQAEEDKPHYEIPWTAIIIIGILALLMAACIIVIFTLGGPVK